MRFVLLSCLITAVLGSGLYFTKLSVDEQYRTLKRLEEEIIMFFKQSGHSLLAPRDCLNCLNYYLG
jgi:hypothetical protein